MLKMIPDGSNQKDCLTVEASPQCANQHLLEIGLVEVEEGENAGDEHCNNPAKPLPDPERSEIKHQVGWDPAERVHEGLLTASAQVHRIRTTVSQSSLSANVRMPCGVCKKYQGT
jgi:hypothetical protein